MSLMVKSSRDSTVLGGRRTQDGCQRGWRCVSDGGLALFCLIIREQMFSDFFYARKLKLLLCSPFIEEKWGSLRKHWCPEELLCHEDWWENVNDFSIADVLLGSCRLIVVNVEHPPPASASHGCSPPFFEFADWTVAGWDHGHTPVVAKHAPRSDALDWEPLRAGSVGYLSKSSNTSAQSMVHPSSPPPSPSVSPLQQNHSSLQLCFKCMLQWRISFFCNHGNQSNLHNSAAADVAIRL